MIRILEKGRFNPAFLHLRRKQNAICGYPPGQEDYEICKSINKCPDAKERIEELPLPSSDPFYGRGPLLNLWKDK